MAGEDLSSYSTSASASAERQSRHQWTGLAPLYRCPLRMILPSARICCASKRGSMVRYGRSQSPSTPRRLKSARCRSTCSCANSRQAARNSFASSLSPTRPCFFSTWCSIGRPWQSQPGTYGASKPSSWCDLTTMSLSTLLTAVADVIAPLAYGGPSCSTKRGRPRAIARSLRVEVVRPPTPRASSARAARDRPSSGSRSRED